MKMASDSLHEHNAASLEDTAIQSNLACYAVCLGPGEEILTKLLEFVSSKNLKAAFIMSCVGSVKRAKLRLANATALNRDEVIALEGNHEIVSLVGTLSGGGHVHASLADGKGTVIGGHVLGEMIVLTTAEVIIGDCVQLCFSREMDSVTGFNELVVYEKQGDS